MNPYSHLVIAAQLENEIQPASREEYFWGAVAPDARYAAGVPRQQTHLAPEEIVKCLGKYPELESFIQGYLVHRLTDMLHIHLLLAQRILFWPMLPLVSGRFIYVLVESFYLQNMPMNFTLSGSPNALLRDLGIADEHSLAFAEAIRPFAAAPSFETAAGFLRSLRRNSAQVEKYVEAGRAIQRNRYLIPFLFKIANLPRLNQQALAALRRDPILRRVAFQPAH